MTFDVLNDNVMLVELSYEEMKKYHITYQNLDGDNKYTQNAVKNILEIVKAGDKFNTSDKITVEVLPVNDGGCFFIFTFSAKKKTRYKMKKANDFLFFKADTLDNLLDFVSALKSAHRKNLKYNIYKIENSFYMQIPEGSQKINAIMWEFGKISEISPEKIREYGVHSGSVTI